MACCGAITQAGLGADGRLEERAFAAKALARIARLILQAKAQIHKAVGWIFGRPFATLGAGDPARAFMRELASNIPLPTDAKMIAVARGVQIAGILLCVMMAGT